MTNENNLMTVDNVPNVEIAKKQWDAYQELCKGILDKSDYQMIKVKEKDENGKYVFVEREFKKKTAWQKLGRAFNVNTRIVEKEFQRSKTGRISEAYYCVRATLPNGRSVESDALCSRSERGKDNVSDHTIMATAKTRATNRAISELIGAGEVSSDEMTAEFRAADDPDHHDITTGTSQNETEKSNKNTNTEKSKSNKKQAIAEDDEFNPADYITSCENNCTKYGRTINQENMLICVEHLKKHDKITPEQYVKLTEIIKEEY